MTNYYTEKINFFGSSTPKQLIDQYGSPLYVYNERILRQRCREMANFVTYPNFKANYSTKANSNLELLKIIREEGLNADAMSPGEIYVLLAAGFRPEQIFYISNNVSEDEMMYAINLGIKVSVDSLSQLETYGKINPGGDVAIRINPGFGIGHHEKVITGGENTKFGINIGLVDDIKTILKQYNLNLTGINQHIGSLFMNGEPYVQSVKAILEFAEQFDDLKYIDLGGGFGIPYKKLEGEKRLELKQFGRKVDELLHQWASRNNSDIMFMIEPGRYVVAECCVLLGTVHALKENAGNLYAGTDLGFNVLVRPVMYDAWHDVEVYPKDEKALSPEKIPVTIVGNICESGDIVAENRMLPPLAVGDILGVLDAGAYGYSMSSNYNNRLRPAEVLIQSDGTHRLIRRRDTLEDLLRNFCCETIPAL
ncbi:MAG TPA: diaminopimelate decarboxylase [Clostridiales bacterium]|nr:diaminopimelate decarboxylase [Clostridiales bacterium]